MMPTRALLRALAAALAGLATLLLLASSPASAHGGEGQIEITSLTRQGSEVTVVAHVIYVADGHGVPDASVTVVVGEDTPVVMEPGAADGDYQATVPAAEGDVIRVTSVEPEVSTEATAPPPAETTTTSEPTSSTSTTTEAQTTESTVEDEGAAGPTPVPDAGSDDDSGGGSNLVVIIAVLVVLVAAGVTVALFLTNRSSSLDGDSPSDV